MLFRSLAESGNTVDVLVKLLTTLACFKIVASLGSPPIFDKAVVGLLTSDKFAIAFKEFGSFTELESFQIFIEFSLEIYQSVFV